MTANELMILGPELSHKLNWPDAVEALRVGHTFPKATISDMLMPMANGEVIVFSMINLKLKLYLLQIRF